MKKQYIFNGCIFKVSKEGDTYRFSCKNFKSFIDNYKSLKEHIMDEGYNGIIFGDAKFSIVSQFVLFYI